VVHVYDLVDDVTGSALRAGHHAAQYACYGAPASDGAPVVLQAGENVHHVVPQTIDLATLVDDTVHVEFRVRQPVEAPVRVQLISDGEVIVTKRERYARPSEMVTLEVNAKHMNKLEPGATLVAQTAPV